MRLASNDSTEWRAGLLQQSPAFCLQHESLAAIRSEISGLQTRNPGLARWLNAELSSDHAGETGAVHIYTGALAALEVSGRVCGCLPSDTDQQGLPAKAPYQHI